ncbi:MAG: Trp biosynthesis-associated membrane protein [Nocardioidaceae bacterium]
MSGSARTYATTVVGGIAAGGITFFAASRTWASVTVRTSGMPTDRVAVDGSQAVPMVSAMALVVLAGSVAVLAGSPRVRILVGAVVTAAAVTAVVYTLTAGSAIEDAVVGQVGESPAMTGDHAAQVALATHADPTMWRWVCLAAALGSVAAGVSVLLFGRRWPTMGRRYDSPARKREADPDPWKALDRGEDPTV